MDIKKLMKEYSYSWKDDRRPYEVFLDNMYQAYLLEKESYGEHEVLDKSEYFEANQDFLLREFKRESEGAHSYIVSKDGTLKDDIKYED